MGLNHTFFLLLAIAILLAWTVSYKKLGLYIFLLAIILGVVQHYITLQGLLVITILGLTHYWLKFKSLSIFFRIFLHGILIIFFVGFAYHLFPGFHPWKLIDQARLSLTSLPYTMYLQVEQPIYGFLFLFFHNREKPTSKPWLEILRWSLTAFLGTSILLMVANYIHPIVAWEPKVLSAQFMFIWMIRMFFSVCLIEEAFFRGYIQATLIRLLHKYDYGIGLACLISACLFGFLYLPAGLPMFVMAMLAGLGYGYAYLKTGYLETAVITHFLINLAHMLLFSYPMLAII
ncbi:MAG: CPBP family intramembrane glutamic endopeptidase [Burkholderiales bacterium]